MKKVYSIIGVLLFSANLQAQSEGAGGRGFWSDVPFSVAGPLTLATVILIAVLVPLIGITIDLGRHAYNQFNEEGKSLPWIIRLFGVFEGDSSSFTGEYADVVLDDHDYDGIQEFDNDLPPWWVYMFYLTGIFAVLYILTYHVFGWAKLQDEEYQAEVELAEKMYADVDLEYDGPITDIALLGEAKESFVANCAACHGAAGQGGVGPNLTDEYWLHKGSVNDIYNTVKYGVEEKGMLPWKNNFSNKQIYEISSYIMTLKGTNPDGAKEPQGDKYPAE